ncbi:MAG: serine/threonine-protein kinase, partial [Gemmatimonadaceae bacterium]
MPYEHSAVAVETLIANRYRILRTIGAGGMATVYQALDTTTDRPVAVKLLHPVLVGSIAADRFLREIALTRRLQHPLVLPILDSGTHEDSPYFVMPLVPGESLRDRLRREKQLAVADAFRIARDVLEALGAAHAQNIVHRDIKPANVLLSSGRATVADFGIARAYSEAAADRVTASGIAVGTAGYMSPEQASGEPHLDGRTDLYAVGCVLYEMLAGEPPFTGPTPHSIVAKQMSQPVPSLAVVRSTVPASLDRLLQRVLAKAPADRIATAAEFAAGLDDIEAGTAVLETRPRRKRHELLVSVGAIAVVFAGTTVAKGLWMGASGATLLGDTTSYAVLPPARVDVAPSVLPDLPDLLREALGRWSGITVSDSAAPRSGRSVAATLSPAGDSLRLRVQLRESNGSLLADHTERLSPNDA